MVEYVVCRSADVSFMVDNSVITGMIHKKYKLASVKVLEIFSHTLLVTWQISGL